MGRVRRALADPILRLYLATGVVLSALLVVGLRLWSASGSPALVLPWYLATVEGLSLLAGVSIAFLCLGRYRVLREPASLWVGVAFLVNGALTLLYILSWPGLVSYGGFITDNPNTAHWLYLLKWSTLAGGLLAAAVLSPVSGRRAGTLAVVAGGLAAVAGVLAILLEERLPLLEERGRWTLPGETWAWLLAVTFAVGSLLALRRYRRDGDYLLGYAAVVQLVAVFIVAEALMGGQRYDTWWYASRTLLIAAYLIILVGLLSEYVGLYRRERDRAEEVRRALAESEMLREIAQEVAGQTDVERVMERVVRYACDLLGPDQAGLLVLKDDGAFAWRVPEQRDGNQEEHALAQAALERLGEGGSPGSGGNGVAAPLRDGRQRLAAVAEYAPLVIPMVAGGTTYGALVLGYRSPRQFAERDVRFAEALAGQGALALEQARARREAAQAEAVRQADRLKSELLATVSHELRTPLGAIKGHATTLARFGPRIRSAQRREFLETIDRAADRLSELIDNLLLVQRLEAGALPVDPERLDLADLAREVVTEVVPRTAGPQIVCILPPALPAVRGDPRRVRQVLLNLLDNAVKYSPQGGEVRVEAEAVGGEVVVSVHDQGVGIPADHLEQVFERFHRVESEVTRTTRGTGLGLAICRGIVEAHGGRIWAESEGVGRGSTFRFTLPLWEEA